MEKKYYKRMVDSEINLALTAMGAIVIMGAKWCGKTTTASVHAKSILRMQDPSTMTNNLLIANTAPVNLLYGDKPRLIDEWQTAPILWDAVRSDVDNTGLKGQYILTGSSTPLAKSTMHSGTGRFARIKMYPMSLYESLDSSGLVSLRELFDGEKTISAVSTKTLEDVAFLICRGGWPQFVDMEYEAISYAMKQYVAAIYNNDINDLEEAKTDPNRVEAFMRSYARCVQTLAKNTTILNDMQANDITISEPTFYSYMDKLQRMFIIDEIPAWAPNIRSKSSIRTSNKKSFCDPSIATAVLDLSPQYLMKDFETFGFLFESLCVRDLRVYSSLMGGKVHHYRDNNNLECDAIVRLPDGRFGLIEVKLGGKLEENAAQNLLKLESLLVAKDFQPSFKMILTAGQYGYTRQDGIHVVPLACLKD